VVVVIARRSDGDSVRLPDDVLIASGKASERRRGRRLPVPCGGQFQDQRVEEVQESVAPPGLVSVSGANPQLTLWAIVCRCSAPRATAESRPCGRCFAQRGRGAEPYPCGSCLTRSRGERGERDWSRALHPRQPVTKRRLARLPSKGPFSAPPRLCASYSPSWNSMDTAQTISRVRRWGSWF
jgi:hypothetical protein